MQVDSLGNFLCPTLQSIVLLFTKADKDYKDSAEL